MAGGERIKQALRKVDPVYQGLSFLHCWAVCGRKEAVRRYREHQEEKRIREELYRQNTLSPEERQRQEQTAFARDVLFSILVPLYNTPAGFLKDMLDSVQGQTYRRWELCLADGSDGDVRILYLNASKREGFPGPGARVSLLCSGRHIRQVNAA